MRTSLTCLLFCTLHCLAPALNAQDYQLERALCLPTLNAYVQSNLYISPIEGSLISGRWESPVEGKQVAVLGETATWEAIRADTAGWFQHPSLRGGYVYANIPSDKEKVVLLESLGNKWAYVNGEARIGNRYQGKDSFEDWEPKFDFLLLPVKLKKGNNDFLFQCNRGRLKVRLHPLAKEVSFNAKDLTLPDCRAGENEVMWGSIVVINAREKPLEGLQIESALEGEPALLSDAGALPPMSVRKIPFRIRANGWGKAPGAATLRLRLLDAGGRTFDEAALALQIREPHGLHRRTYRSSVDGSIQYYAVLPATAPGAQALVLSVHGANVEAWNQGDSYAQKSWASIVAPTNRRPYGYNWEDWGRIDAIDVLELAQQQLEVDPGRVYLTGHSMGGHGTWILGSTYPDRFAAIAPSAGYLRVETYYGRYYNDKGLRSQPMLVRAKNATLTDSLLTNLRNLGVYVLHGGADDVVRPEQAYRALEILSGFHKDYQYHEEPGVGHWWDHSDEPGADCVDWPPLFDFFARKARPGMERILNIDFKTADPSVSGTYYWGGIYEQEHYLDLSRIQLQWAPAANRVSGSTGNVKALTLDPAIFNKTKPAILKIDGDSLQLDWAKYAVDGLIYLAKADGHWRLSPRPSLRNKGPHRYGGFKSVINNDVIFVYATDGTVEENAWALQKARFDAECFWYQGNGSIEVIADAAFDTASYKGRNVVLYGNATTNRAWAALLGDSPIQLSRDKITFGRESLTGRNLAALFVRPRADSDNAVVGVVGGTGLQGKRLTNTLPYLYQNFALPDVLIFDDSTADNPAPKALELGYFGSDWSIEQGEWE
ncbi:MAG: prolyl oligopeptidase family serine peptidase [Phaeodactylibacter sp.]|nr:prolyl oligopeptidase family serine peptidase [Phaeodactylibacter sp.]